MANPYRVLGVDETGDDDEIRRRYLELVRRFPPERSPEEFQKVHTAYERLADERSRLRFQLFEPSHGESLDEWIEEIRCEARKTRPGLESLRSLFQDK